MNSIRYMKITRFLLIIPTWPIDCATYPIGINVWMWKGSMKILKHKSEKERLHNDQNKIKTTQWPK